MRGLRAGAPSVSESGADRGREVWADVAKAGCIVLVVLYHVVTKQQVDLPGLGDLPATTGWQHFCRLLTSVRMPLFFLISGYFAARAVRRNWQSVLRRRVWNNVYLHILWLLIAYLVHHVVGTLTENGAEGVGDVVLAVVTAFTGLWYMYGLATYFVVAKLWLRWAPGWSLVTAGAALALVTATGYVPGRGNTDSILENAVWFFAGVVFAGTITSLARRPRPRLAAVCTVSFLVGAIALLRWDFGRVEGLLELPLRLTAVTVGLLLSVVAQTWLPSVSRSVAVLGRQTLPIYVMHGLLLIGVDRLVRGWFETTAPSSQALALVWAPVLSVLLVGVSLLLHRLFLAAGMSWLFTLPGRGPAVRTRTVHVDVTGPASRSQQH